MDRDPDADDDRAWADAWTVQTARLRIGPCDAAAARALARMAADPRVAESYWIGTPQPDAGPARERHWLQRADDWTRLGRFSLVACERAGGGVIGGLQLTRGALSYLVDPACWGRGLGGEMARACCLEFPSRLGLAVLRATVLRENRRSVRVLEGAGFAYDGLAVRAVPARAGRATLLGYRRDCGAPPRTG